MFLPASHLPSTGAAGARLIGLPTTVPDLQRVVRAGLELLELGVSGAHFDAVAGRLGPDARRLAVILLGGDASLYNSKALKQQVRPGDTAAVAGWLQRPENRRRVTDADSPFHFGVLDGDLLVAGKPPQASSQVDHRGDAAEKSQIRIG
jgi:hypothetical protein